MHYENDSQGIFNAKEQVRQIELEIEIANKEKQIDLIEKEISLLENKLDILDEEEDRVNDFYDNLLKQTESYYDQQIKNLEKQRTEVEKFYESITKNLESQKSKFQELTEILEKAELSAKLKQLGIDEEALLNGSEEEFNKLKDAYMNIVTQLNSGNDEVLSSLRELSGYEGTAPTIFEDSNSKLDEMNGKLNTSSQNVGTVNSSLAETATKTSDVATNVSNLNDNLSQVSTTITEEQTAIDTLRKQIDEVIAAINEKIIVTQIGQTTTAIAMTTEMAYYMLLKEKIIEVKESLDSISNTVTAIDVTPVNNLTIAFQLLYNQLLLVSTTLGAGMEGAEEGAVGDIASAIQALNEISLEEGIIAQFTNLKAAIDGVVSAISGGGSSGDSASGSSGEGKESGTGGSAGGLVGAIEDIKSATDKALGGGGGGEGSGGEDGEGKGSEGGGTGAIGQFEQLKTAVDNVTTSIGSEGNEGTEGENSDTLIGSIDDLGESVTDTLGEPGGEGVIGRFEKFKEPIQEAETHVKGIYKGLKDIDGEEVECTIKVKIETSGSTGFTGSAQVLGSMNLNSTDYHAQYTGNAHYEGTAEVTGDWGVKQGGETLVGELGQELVVFPNGRFKTIGDNGAEFVNIPAGSIVFNHLQTRELLSKGNIVGRGRMLATGSALASGTAYANGTTDDDEWFILPNGERVREPRLGDRAYELQKAFEPLLKNIDENIDLLTTNANARYDKDMTELEKHVTNNVNNVTNKNIYPAIHGGINITCPGVTSQEVARQVGVEVNRMFNGMYLEAEQRSRMR